MAPESRYSPGLQSAKHVLAASFSLSLSSFSLSPSPPPALIAFKKRVPSVLRGARLLIGLPGLFWQKEAYTANDCYSCA